MAEQTANRQTNETDTKFIVMSFNEEQIIPKIALAADQPSADTAFYNMIVDYLETEMPDVFMDLYEYLKSDSNDAERYKKLTGFFKSRTDLHADITYTEGESFSAPNANIIILDQTRFYKVSSKTSME